MTETLLVDCIDPQSQRNKIISYMEEHGSITSLEATHYLNIMSPRKRLSEINEVRPLHKEAITIVKKDNDGHSKAVRFIKYSFAQ